MSGRIIRLPECRSAIQTDWWWTGDPPRIQWGAWYVDDDRDEVCGFGAARQAAIADLVKNFKPPPREE